RELGEGREDGERRCLAEPAERGDLDHLGERAHALTLDGPVEHPEEPRGPLAARGALAARLARVEGEQRPHDVLNRHALVEGDDAARSRIDRTARDERLVELPRGNGTPGRPAQDGGAERPARRGAAAEIVEQRPQRRAEGDLDDPRAPDVARGADRRGAPARPPAPRRPGGARPKGRPPRGYRGWRAWRRRRTR